MKNLILSGTAKKSKNLFKLTISAYILGILCLLLSLLFPIISPKTQEPSSTIIITTNGSGAIINTSNIKTFILIALGSLILFLGILLSIMYTKHKNDYISVFEEEVKIKSKNCEKTLSYSNITEFSLIEEKRRKLLGNTIVIKTKTSEQKYTLFNIDNSEKIIEIVHKKISQI